MTSTAGVVRGRSAPRAALATANRLLSRLVERVLVRPVAVLVVAAVAVRLPFLDRPPSPDEGGFLMVAGQWSPGTSLYGSYWVDRPPLLVTLYQLADVGGGLVALRLLGAAAVGTSVVLAALLARTLGRLAGRPEEPSRRRSTEAAAVAAVFLVSPLFGASEVDGELLAVPLVLGGLVAVITAHQRSGRPAYAWWIAAGALALAAAAVKQNMLEAFVAAAVVVMAQLRRRPGRAACSALAFGAGVAGALATVLAWSAWHGTSPAALWDAVVTFRAQASAVIAQSAPATTNRRALGVLSAFVSSGALAVVLLSLCPTNLRGWRRSWSLARVLAVAVLAWEAFGVAAGGSYWLHYLVGTVAGLVLVVGCRDAPGPRWTRAAVLVLSYAAVVALGGLVARVVTPVGEDQSDAAVELYLHDHAHPGDTGVVAFGDPALLEGASLPSPYPLLWSLPVRVRDPQLRQLTAILTGADRPTWLVVDGTSLATWGVDPSRAQPVVERDYRIVRTFGSWEVYRVRGRVHPRSSLPSA